MLFLTATLQILLVILSIHTRMLLTECPHFCECKWKSGKESVVCTNANLSSVPLHLDAGTQVLNLTSNSLSTIKHDEFSQAGLLNLQKIYISKCKLKNLDRLAFRNLINLVELDLSYNLLNSVPSYVFDWIPELRELKLSGNPIQRITNEAFVRVPQLVRLELSDCKIGTIEIRAFYGLEKSLEWLNLENNRLVDVHSGSLMILHSLHGLDLAGNPWNCSCTLRPLREWMLKNNIPFGVPPVCQYPKRLQSRPWDKLELDEFACVPEIFAYETKANGVEGKNVTMTCRITGVPAPNVRWLLKNKVIANLSGAPYTNGKKLYIVHLQNNASVLTILTADLQDAGVYVCAAENKAGRAEASVTLAVSRRPHVMPLTSKVLMVSVVAGAILAFGACLIVICLWTLKKKQSRSWRNVDCRNEESYEKIEMNHKAGSVNGRTNNQSEISVVGVLRKNGDYRVVPGADTDQEGDEEEDSIEAAMLKRGVKETKFINPPRAEKTIDQWSGCDQLDNNDLHIPRRTLHETRDDFKRNQNSTSGTYNPTYQIPSTSMTSSVPQTFQPPFTKKQVIDSTAGGALYTTAYSSELSSLAESDLEQKYPDLLDNSSSSPKKFNNLNATKANSEGGSVTDINEIFCTLPRKRAMVQNPRYMSTDSQSPLLPESRYGSSGGESSVSSRDSCRRLSDSQKFPSNNLNKNRANLKSSSYLNLTSSTRHSSVPHTPNREYESTLGGMPLNATALNAPVYKGGALNSVALSGGSVGGGSMGGGSLGGGSLGGGSLSGGSLGGGSLNGGSLNGGSLNAGPLNGASSNMGPLSGVSNTATLNASALNAASLKSSILSPSSYSSASYNSPNFTSPNLNSTGFNSSNFNSPNYNSAISTPVGVPLGAALGVPLSSTPLNATALSSSCHNTSSYNTSHNPSHNPSSHNSSSQNVSSHKLSPHNATSQSSHNPSSHNPSSHTASSHNPSSHTASSHNPSSHTHNVSSRNSSTHNASSLNPTPLLDVNSLENRITYKQDIISPTPSIPSANANTYDYHAAQLERFLEEYRSLQKQLTKMKETCDNLRQDKNKFSDPLFHNSLPVTPSSSDDSNPKSILKKSPGMMPMSPNANQSLEDSIRFPSYESELSRFLLSKGLTKSLDNSGMFNNK